MQLSEDINDFASRYRVVSQNPTSDNDAGDLIFNTSTQKLLVYNSTSGAFEEAQSVGNFFISTLSPAFNGSVQDFTITNAPSNAQQIILSINGVIQKPNAGSSTPSEGFALSGSTVKLAAAPASGSDYFAIVLGSTVNIGTPSNNTVTSAMIVDGSIVNGDISNSADIAGSKLSLVSTSSTAGVIVKGDGSSDGYLQLNCSQNSHGIKLKSPPHSAGQSYTLTFPSNIVNGQFLTTDANGNLSWAAVVTDLVNDTTPQLGGDLDTNSHNISLDDSHFVNFGDSNDLRIRHDGTNSVITGYTNQTWFQGDNLYLSSATAQETYLYAVENGGVELYYDNSKRFETNSAGVHVFGNMFIEDGSSSTNKITLGTGGDLNIFHDGTNSFLQNHTGILYIKSKSNQEAIRCVPDAQVELMYNDSGKYSTASNGGVLTGGAPYTELLVQTSAGLSQGKIIGWGSGNAREIGFAEPDSQQWFIRCDKNTSNGTRNEYHWQSITPAVDNSYDLGNSSYRWRNIYTNDLNLSNEGHGNDVDGTWGSYTIQEGAEDLFLINKRNGKKYKFNLTEVN